MSASSRQQPAHSNLSTHDKTDIGRASIGFDFLGLPDLPKYDLPIGILPSASALSRLHRNTTRLYEQGASKKRIGQYWKGWLVWAALAPGVAGAVSPLSNDGSVPMTDLVSSANECHLIELIGFGIAGIATSELFGDNFFNPSSGYATSPEKPFRLYENTAVIITLAAGVGMESATFIPDSSYVVTKTVSGNDIAFLSFETDSAGEFINCQKADSPFPNADPTITSSATPSVMENTTAVQTVIATDTDVGDTLTFSLTGGADQALFDITTDGVLTFKAAPDFENPSDVGVDNVYEVQVTVSDGNGGTDAQDIAVTVTDVAEPLTISGTPPTGVVFDNLYTFTPTAVDPDGTAIVFSIAGQPSWAAFDTATGTLSGTPALGDAGIYDNIVITASNPVQTIVSESNQANEISSAAADSVSLAPFRIIVAGVNQAPTFNLFGSNPVVCTNAGGHSIPFVTAISDGDFETQQLQFIVENDNPSLFGGLLGLGGQPFMSAGSGRLGFRGGLNQSGSADVTVRLKDDGGTANGGNDTSITRIFTITIDPNCDDGAGELFNPGQFDFDPVGGFVNNGNLANLGINLNLGGAANNPLLNIGDVGNVPLGGLDNIGNIPLGGVNAPTAPQSPEIPFGAPASFTATISNQFVAAGQNVVLSIRLGAGQQFTQTDKRCAVDTNNGQASCYLNSVPSGLTKLGFEATAPEGEEVNATAEISAANDTEFRDNSAQLRAAIENDRTGNTDGAKNNGGGSMGWLSLLGLAALRRRK